jgi:hypothetical protein
MRESETVARDHKQAGKTISAQQIFEALHGWDSRMRDQR